MLTLVHIWKVNMIGSHLEGEHAYAGSHLEGEHDWFTFGR